MINTTPATINIDIIARAPILDLSKLFNIADKPPTNNNVAAINPNIPKIIHGFFAIKLPANNNNPPVMATNNVNAITLGHIFSASNNKNAKLTPNIKPPTTIEYIKIPGINSGYFVNNQPPSINIPVVTTINAPKLNAPSNILSD